MDHDLEAAIDQAGRANVFAIVRNAGWCGYDSPPKWVWWMAVLQVRKVSAHPEFSPAPTLH